MRNRGLAPLSTLRNVAGLLKPLGPVTRMSLSPSVAALIPVLSA